MARSLFSWLLVTCVAIWLGLYVFGIFLTQGDGGGFDQNLRRVGTAVARQLDRDGDTQAQARIDSLVEYVAGPRPAGAGGPVDYLIRVRKRDQELVYLSASSDPWPTLQPTEGWSDQRWQDREYRAYVTRTSAGYEVLVAHAHDARRGAYNRAMLSPDTLVKPWLGGFLFLLVVVTFAVRRGLRPLHRLSDELSARAPGDLRRIDEEGLKLELRPVVRAFNTTLQRLEQVRLQEQRFLADAAHELRTPLALVSAQADALLVAEDEAAKDLAVERLRRGLVRANRVIGQLLALARLDSGSAKQQDWLNLSESAADVLAALEPEASQKSIELSLQAPDVLRCLINAEHFDMLLGNLVANAIRHQQGPGFVQVSLATESDKLVLLVLDDGPGIPPAQLEDVFQRFHRLHPQTGNGSGLGLAIVAEVIALLQGEIQLSNATAQGGLVVRAQWPIAAPA